MLGKKTGRQRYNKAILNIRLASPLAPSLLRYHMVSVADGTMDSDPPPPGGWELLSAAAVSRVGFVLDGESACLGSA